MPSIAASSTAEKYLSVLLQNETYGIPVLRIREIIRVQKITPLPQAPDFLKGIINLRGRVVPVADLRTKLGLVASHDEQNCIVVALVRGENGRDIVLGLVVDRVDEVLTLEEATIEPPPDFGVGCDTAFLRGMAKVRERVTTLLDLDRVFYREALAGLGAAA